MRILDATAGLRTFWKDKQPKEIVFVDRRVLVRPDVVADDRFLPFRDGAFGIVYFDPPHQHGAGGRYSERYGGFGSYDDLRSLFRKATVEFARVLHWPALMIVKLTKTGSGRLHHPCVAEDQIDTRFSEYAALAGFRLLAKRFRASRGASRRARVVWMTFRCFP